MIFDHLFQNDKVPTIDEGFCGSFENVGIDDKVPLVQKAIFALDKELVTSLAILLYEHSEAKSQTTAIVGTDEGKLHKVAVLTFYDWLK